MVDPKPRRDWGWTFTWIFLVTILAAFLAGGTYVSILYMEWYAAYDAGELEPWEPGPWEGEGC